MSTRKIINGRTADYIEVSSPTTLYTGTKQIGTDPAEQLVTTETPISSVTLVAHANNQIIVGDSSLTSANKGTDGMLMTSSGGGMIFVTIDIDDLSNLYLISSSSPTNVSWVAS